MGHLNSLWSINLDEIGRLEIGKSEHIPNPQWNHHQRDGNKYYNTNNWPHPVANHTSVVYKDKMYLFGGSSGMCENQDFWSFDLHSNIWTLLKPKTKNNDPKNNP